MTDHPQPRPVNGLASAGVIGASIEAELDRVAEALEAAMRAGDLSIFYDAFRATGLPFVVGDLRDDPVALFHHCFQVIHRLGTISPATALAVENHYYVTSALATFPAVGDAIVQAAQLQITDAIAAKRLLVANSNSKVHTDKLGAIGTVARRTENGFCLSGEASYTSLSTEADLMVLLTEIEDEGFAFFAIDELKSQDSIEIGQYLFPNAMIHSDTRKIRFRDLDLPRDALLADADSPLALHLVPFEMAWHQTLIAAIYLGAAARAIEEARLFLRATGDREGAPLAQLDGLIVDVGRLGIAYQGALGFAQSCGNVFADLRELPRDAAASARLSALASAAKYIGTRTAEEIVTAVRRIVGARSFSGGHVLERLSSEVMFASLGPEVGAVIERRFGRQILGEEPFRGTE